MNNEAVTTQLQIDEELRLKPYDDATGKELKRGDTIVGNITIGIGRNLSGIGISANEAYFLNGNDIRRTVRELDAALPWWSKMSDNRQDALLNLAFNVGVPTLLTFKNSLTLLQAGRWDAAAAEFKNSKWHSQVGARADRIIEAIKEG